MCARRMSNIRDPKRASSDVGFFPFDQPFVECRIFDIQRVHGKNKYWEIYMTVFDFWTGQIFPKILYTFY